MELRVEWLGRMAYRTAWDRQRALVAARVASEVPDTLLLVEHEPVLTLGRHATEAHVLATPDELAGRGLELVRVERGGEVTYHGPGQLVAYPIVALAERGVLLRPFVRALEAAMADTASDLGVAAGPRTGYPGCWVDADGPAPRKLGALGLRVERGVTFHGIALNVTTDLSGFGLIDPCGMAGLDVTSIARERRWPADRSTPSTESVQAAAVAFAAAFERRLANAVGAERRDATHDRATAAPGPVRASLSARDRAA
jgi:lipoyl(octanoyl) transferase